MIFGAMDTTSRAMARIIHVLAQNPDAQERARNEIMEAQQANGDIDFDTLMDLPYLDAIMRETLRL
jgi:cytochrome P450